MGKPSTKKKPTAARQDTELARLAVQRALFRRIVASKRDVSRLARQLRAAHERAVSDTEGLLRFLSHDGGYALVPREMQEALNARLAELEATARAGLEPQPVPAYDHAGTGLR